MERHGYGPYLSVFFLEGVEIFTNSDLPGYYSSSVATSVNKDIISVYHSTQEANRMCSAVR